MFIVRVCMQVPNSSYSIEKMQQLLTEYNKVAQDCLEEHQNIYDSVQDVAPHMLMYVDREGQIHVQKKRRGLWHFYDILMHGGASHYRVAENKALPNAIKKLAAAATQPFSDGEEQNKQIAQNCDTVVKALLAYIQNRKNKHRPANKEKIDNLFGALIGAFDRKAPHKPKKVSVSVSPHHTDSKIRTITQKIAPLELEEAKKRYTSLHAELKNLRTRVQNLEDEQASSLFAEFAKIGKECQNRKKTRT